MAKYVLDTNVLIHAIRNEQARGALAAWQREMGPHLYWHAIVVTELLAGAKDEATMRRWHERWVAPAEDVRRIITPGQGTWVRAARIIVRLVQSGHVGRSGIRPGFASDCLLAASARDAGFTIVTHNLRDFRLIKRVEPRLAYVAPFP